MLRWEFLYENLDKLKFYIKVITHYIDVHGLEEEFLQFSDKLKLMLEDIGDIEKIVIKKLGGEYD